MHAISCIKSFCHLWLKSQSGNIAIVTGLALPVLVGFCGLGIETGYWYFRERDIQAAADIAAYSGTVALRGGGSHETVVAITKEQATKNGWLATTGTITVNTPPTSGPNQNNNSVEVLLTESEKRYFTAIFGNQNVATNVRAVATYISSGPACMLALDKSASGAMTFWGNAYANFTDCNVVSNSLADDSFKVGGAANVTTPCASSAGGANVSAYLTLTECTSVNVHSPPAQDPYSAVPAPPIPSSCSSFPNSGTASPGKFCGGVTIQNTVNLNPGVYVISGGTLKVNASANITGSGVTFYLTNGAHLEMNGNSHFDLTAPTTGDMKGLLFYGDRTMPYADQTINGNASSKMTGALYFPSQNVKFLGSFSGDNGCMQVIGDTIYYTGSSLFKTDCSGTGMQGITVPGTVSLAE